MLYFQLGLERDISWENGVDILNVLVLVLIEVIVCMVFIMIELLDKKVK